MITTPFPEEAYNRYLKTCNISADSDLGPTQMKKILRLAAEDFERGALSSDGLGSVAGRLFKLLAGQELEKEEKVLFDRLESVAELGYLLRKGDAQTFISILKEVLLYSRINGTE